MSVTRQDVENEMFLRLPDNVVRYIDPAKLRVVIKKLLDYLDEVSVLNGIQFKIGDGQVSTPIDGATTYSNPALAGKSGGIITRNGLPIPGPDYEGIEFLNDGGFSLTTDDDIFRTGEIWTWIIPGTAIYEPNPTYQKYSDIPINGPNSLMFCLIDNSEGGDSAEALLCRINNKVKQVLIS